MATTGDQNRKDARASLQAAGVLTGGTRYQSRHHETASPGAHSHINHPWPCGYCNSVHGKHEVVCPRRYPDTALRNSRPPSSD